MRQVITVKDVETLIKNGTDISAIPADAIITPAAQDLLSELGRMTARSTTSALQPSAQTENPSGHVSNNSGMDIESLFNSPENAHRKEQICEVGRRMWARDYLDGNGGNISIRVDRNLVLCTPTRISKGFMKPADLCMVDLDGNRKAGEKKPTSEILMHLEIMKAQPRAVACVHCHPPYATAFAASGVQPPNKILPEFELFVGEVPIAGYETPGTIEIARKVASHSSDHSTILMANHGVVAWSDVSVEDAYLKIEILEAYCRTIAITSQLGAPPNRFTSGQMKELLNIKQTMGVHDPRIGKDISEIALQDDAQWRPGVICASPPDPKCQCQSKKAPVAKDRDESTEELIQQITDLIMQRVIEPS